MTPIIDKEKTGRQIRRIMETRGLTVQDVRESLSLGCVQSVYHWFDGKSIPSYQRIGYKHFPGMPQNNCENTGDFRFYYTEQMEMRKAD